MWHSSPPQQQQNLPISQKVTPLPSMCRYAINKYHHHISSGNIWKTICGRCCLCFPEIERLWNWWVITCQSNSMLGESPSNYGYFRKISQTCYQYFVYVSYTSWILVHHFHHFHHPWETWPHWRPPIKVAEAVQPADPPATGEADPLGGFHLVKPLNCSDGYFLVAIVGFLGWESAYSILYSLAVLQQLLLVLGYLGCHVSGLW